MALESAATDVAVNTSGPAPVTTLELVKMVTELAGGGPGKSSSRACVGEEVQPRSRGLTRRWQAC